MPSEPPPLSSPEPPAPAGAAAPGSPRAVALVAPALLFEGPVGLSPSATVGVAVAVLASAAALAVLRRALLRCAPARVLELAGASRRARLEPLLARAEELATSAGLFELALDLAFLVLLLAAFAGDDALRWGEVLGALAVAAPLLLLAREVLPAAVVGRVGDRVLARWLPAFHLAQLPLSFVPRGVVAAQRGLRRLLGAPEAPPQFRTLVEDLREAMVDAELEGGLDASERAILEKVVEFHDVDVAAVMTPRTEVAAVDVEAGLLEAVRTASEEGHSRFPVYRGSLDQVVGVFSTRDVLPLVADGRVAEARLEDIVRPAYFVPETKRVSELLQELRAQKLKLAVVLDEYGGTAGIVTLGDVLGELVGDLHDEYDEEEPEAIQRVDAETAIVDAGERVSEVNEALGLDLPEEADYETLAGFVLAHLGRFPEPGETFQHDGLEVAVTEASDRRVLRVRLTRLTADPAATDRAP